MANDLVTQRRPNFTIPPSATESLRTALPAVRPYQPNFTIPPGTGARQAFDIEMPQPQPAVRPVPRATLRPVDPVTGKYGSSTALVPTAPQAVAPAVPTAAPSVSQRLSGAASTTGAALRQVGPAMTGFGAAAGVNELRQRQLDNAPAMPAPGETAPGQIPVDTRLVAPPAAAGSLLSQSELGRNVGNALMATPLGTGASAGLRAAANLVRAGAPVATAAKIATVGGSAARGYAAGDAATPGVSAKAPVLESTPTIREPFSDVRNGTYGGGPPDLTGKIVRNGNTYTGSNVKAGADIVDPAGNLLNTDDPTNPLSLRRTGVSVAGPGGAGRSPMDIYANTSRINGQISETARALDAYGPGGAGGGPAAGINGNGLFDSLRTKQGAGTAPTRTERMAQAALAAQREDRQAQIGATLRGQEMSAGTARYGADLSASTLRRGQDMDYAEKIDAKRFDLAAREAQRRAIAAAWQGTTDPDVAGSRLAALGYDPSGALAVGNSRRASAEASAKTFDKNTEALGATTDKDGKPVLNPALQAVAQNVIANAAPGVRNASPADQNARLRETQAMGNLAVGLQEAQGGSLFQTLGIDKPPPAVSTLPNMQGASLRERGIGSPFANASRGDYELVQPDGTVVPIKRSRVNERELEYMKQQGATLRALN